MFNDTSRYLDDIFTIDNAEFEKHIPDIYWATKETPRLYIPILFATKISGNIFLIKYERYNV